MIKSKLFEVRDRGTLLVVLATKLEGETLREKSMLRHEGFSADHSDVVLHSFSQNTGDYDPFAWSYGRTTMVAHLYIREHWDELNSGDIIDVEYLSKEKDHPETNTQIPIYLDVTDNE